MPKQARNISNAAREAAERIYRASGTGPSADIGFAWKGDERSDNTGEAGSSEVCSEADNACAMQGQR